MQENYQLTSEQEKTLEEVAGKFGLECTPFGFGSDILSKDPRDKTGRANIRVGRVDKCVFPLSTLEIYNFRGLPESIRDSVKKMLKECGFNQTEKPENKSLLASGKK